MLPRTTRKHGTWRRELQRGFEWWKYLRLNKNDLLADVGFG
jgi:hypothetical protein